MDKPVETKEQLEALTKDEAIEYAVGKFVEAEAIAIHFGSAYIKMNPDGLVEVLTPQDVMLLMMSKTGVSNA